MQRVAIGFLRDLLFATETVPNDDGGGRNLADFRQQRSLTASNRDLILVFFVGVAETESVSAVCMNYNERRRFPLESAVGLRKIRRHGVRSYLDSVNRCVRCRDNLPRAANP